eukprot:360718-Chlamydomonas_euryale.AAC.1
MSAGAQRSDNTAHLTAPNTASLSTAYMLRALNHQAASFLASTHIHTTHTQHTQKLQVCAATPTDEGALLQDLERLFCGDADCAGRVQKLATGRPCLRQLPHNCWELTVELQGGI